MKTYVKFCSLALIGLFIGGCSKLTVRVEDMLPTHASKAQPVIAKTLTVVPVIGGEPSENLTKVVVNVNNAEYTEAVRQALIQTELFREVRAGAQGDLILHTEIISQKITVGSAIYTLLVHYEVRDGSSGVTLWRRNYYSQVNAYDLKDQYGVSDWFPRVRARTVQDNLSQFIIALSKELPTVIIGVR